MYLRFLIIIAHYNCTVFSHASSQLNLLVKGFNRIKKKTNSFEKCECKILHPYDISYDKCSFYIHKLYIYKINDLLVLVFCMSW